MSHDPPRYNTSRPDGSVGERAVRPAEDLALLEPGCPRQSADPIERITPEGVELRSGARFALDVIVFATGFDAMTGPLLNLGIEGRGGLKLRQAWANGPRSWLGLAIPGFPNMFTITGPGSPSVLCNTPVAIERHVEWITGCIAAMRRRGVERIEAEPRAVDEWIGHVIEAANATLLPQVPHSWYLGANIPGKPRVFMPYAGGLHRYRAICDDVAAKGLLRFHLFGRVRRTDGAQAARGADPGSRPGGAGRVGHPDALGSSARQARRG